MEFKRNADELMRHIRVDENMYRAIMEGRKTKKNRRFTFRKAAVPVAAALLMTSAMYVGAGYVMERTPLREFFAGKDDETMTVPESQKMQDIYSEVMDAMHPVQENRADTIPESTDAVGDSTETGEADTAVPMGKYGEIIIDHELFSIELLETTCTGRELSFSYILTQKTEERVLVKTRVDTDYYGERLDGSLDVPADSSCLLLDNGFGKSYSWKKLPEDCVYELEENQWLYIETQLAKKEYSSGIYNLYAEYYREPKPEEEKETESKSTGHTYVKAPIEIISNDRYGLAMSGTTDKAEGDVHFDTYDVYVSPWTVYLALDGTYPGEMSSIWGAKSTHEIIIGFKDGTQTQTTVRLAGMVYGSGEINVKMRASFETAIDPDSISSVILDGVAIMGE